MRSSSDFDFVVDDDDDDDEMIPSLLGRRKRTHSSSHQEEEQSNDDNEEVTLCLEALTNETIREAVQLWISKKHKATRKYGEISQWDTSQVTDMSHLFAHTIILPKVEEDYYDSDESEDEQPRKGILSQYNTFNEDISKWNVSNVTTMHRMFYQAIKFNQPLNDWNVSNVIDMSQMFYRADEFNQPLDRWDVSKVITMNQMFATSDVISSLNKYLNTTVFRSDSKYNHSLNNWDVSNVTDMSFMFHGCKQFNQPLGAWNV